MVKTAGDHHDFYPQLANGGNVVVHTRILVKETVAIEKDVRISNQIDGGHFRNSSDFQAASALDDWQSHLATDVGDDSAWVD